MAAARSITGRGQASPRASTTWGSGTMFLTWSTGFAPAISIPATIFYTTGVSTRMGPISRFATARRAPRIGVSALVGEPGFDFVRDLGAQMPMRTIGMLLGIPESDQEAVRDHADANLRTKPGEAMQFSQEEFGSGEAFAEYIDWRADHPSDDLMTELLQAEFEDLANPRGDVLQAFLGEGQWQQVVQLVELGLRHRQAHQWVAQKLLVACVCYDQDGRPRGDGCGLAAVHSTRSLLLFSC
mgnify:CR=1 FL=1